MAQVLETMNRDEPAAGEADAPGAAARESGRLQDAFGERIGAVGRTWRATFSQRLRRHRISYPQFLTLRILDAQGDGMVQRDLAEALGIEGSTLVGLLDRLTAADLVERREARHDRRFKTVHLTDQARRLLARLADEQAALRRELLAGIDDADLAACMRVFDGMMARAEMLNRAGAHGARTAS